MRHVGGDDGGPGPEPAASIIYVISRTEKLLHRFLNI
jgi:hypothetical protein